MSRRPRGDPPGAATEAVAEPTAETGEQARRRARLRQWWSTFAVYLASALVMGLGAAEGVIDGLEFLPWCAGVLIGQMLVRQIIRSGRSERYTDPAMTEIQVVLALGAVLWAYLICGAWRNATLFPIMLILMFAAFSSSWRRLAALTLLALLGLLGAVLLLHAQHPQSFDKNAAIANLLMLCVMLPACSLLAARLAGLRGRLLTQRDRLTRALADVERLSMQDEVTGLKNRRRMHELLELEHRRAVRSGRTFCIALVAADGAAAPQPSLRLPGSGLPTSGPMLRALADEALGTMRVSDVLGRWDQGVFILMMPDTRAGLARLGVERLRERIGALPPLSADATEAAPGISLAAGVVEHRAGESVTDAVERAARALDAARSQGGNRVVMA